MNLGAAIKKVGIDILKAIKYPFVHAAMLAKILDRTYVVASDAVTNEPQVKELIVGLVQNLEKLSPDVIADIAAKGTDIVADARTIADVKAAFTYFKETFLPAIETIYKDIEGDVAATDPAPAPVVAALPAPAPAVSAGVDPRLVVTHS